VLIVKYCSGIFRSYVSWLYHQALVFKWHCYRNKHFYPNRINSALNGNHHQPGHHQRFSVVKDEVKWRRKVGHSLQRLIIFISLNNKSKAMTTTIKWVVFCIMFAIVAIWLYTIIDSAWSQQNNASIWITILFFLSAVATILCGFNAVDKEDSMLRG
jgi:hypothetical protein